MVKPTVDFLQWNAPIVNPDTGFPTEWFMRQFNVQRENAVELSALFKIELVAGDGLTGGGVLGDLSDITFTLDNEYVMDLVASLLVDGPDIEWSYNDADDELTPELTDTGVAAGVYGDADNTPVITVDAKGRITLLSTVPTAGAGGGGSGEGGYFNGIATTAPSVSSSAFATKGNVFIPAVDMYVTAIHGLVDAASATDTYNARIAEVSSIGTIVSVLASGTPADAGSTDMRDLRYKLSAPVLLTAGTRYLIALSNTESTGTTVCALGTVAIGTATFVTIDAPGAFLAGTAYQYNTTGLSAAQAVSASGSGWYCVWIEGTLADGGGGGGSGLEHAEVMSRVSLGF